MIASHPEVLEVAVIGLPGEKWRRGYQGGVGAPTEQRGYRRVGLIDYYRERVAHFKYPASVDFMETMPKGGTKVKKTLLRAKYRV